MPNLSIKSRQHHIEEFPLTSPPAKTLSPRNSTKEEKFNNTNKYCENKTSHNVSNNTEPTRHHNVFRENESLYKSSCSTNDGNPFPKYFHRHFNNSLQSQTRNSKQYYSAKSPSIIPKRRTLELAAFVLGLFALISSSNIGTLLIHLNDDLGNTSKTHQVTNSTSMNLSKDSNTAISITKNDNNDINAVPIKKHPRTSGIGSTNLSLNKLVSDCYELRTEWEETLKNVRFGLESITLQMFSYFGIFGNILVIAILIQLIKDPTENRNHKPFDRILIALAVFDSLLLIIYVVDAIIQIDILSEPWWYEAIFPHFWHPTKAIITTASQYMVVAISIERYVVICHKPVRCPKQLYVTIMVFMFSTIVNVPRFFEFKRHLPLLEKFIDQRASIRENIDEETDRANVKKEKFSLPYHTSKLGENPNWNLLMAYHEFSLILFCLIVIVYCNLQVGLQVLRSSRIQKHRNGGIQRSTLTTKTSGDRSMKLTLISIKDRKEPKDAKMTQGCQVDVHVDGKDNLIPTLSNGSIVQNVKEAHTLDNATKVKFPSEVDTPISFEDDILRKDHAKCSHQAHNPKSTETQNKQSSDCASSGPRTSTSSANNNINENQGDVEHDMNKTSPSAIICKSDSLVQVNSSGDEPSIEVIHKETNTPLENPGRRTSEYSWETEQNDSKEYFKRLQNKTIGILFGIVLIFLCCNLPRLTLKIYDIYYINKTVQKHFIRCDKANQLPVPAALHILANLNQVLLVVNSSTNFIIYCICGNRFRTAIKKLFRRR